MDNNKLVPDYIFESSWEVCNKVGGIYTVLSTRAKTLVEQLGDKLIFIGPDCWGEKTSPYFAEDDKLFASWRKKAEKEGLKVKIGRWTVPGNPVAILVDFNQYYAEKDMIYGQLWEKYHVDSLHAYGDYDEASMFSYAAGRFVEAVVKHCLKASDKVVYQFPEDDFLRSGADAVHGTDPRHRVIRLQILCRAFSCSTIRNIRSCACSFRSAR